MGKRVVRPFLLSALGFSLAWWCASAQQGNAPSFEVAAVKPASPRSGGIECTGGPGTADPGRWRCSNVSVAFLISKAFGYLPYQFDPGNRCCQARVDLAATMPAKTTRAQFRRMQQNLLADRFRLKVHFQQKE